MSDTAEIVFEKLKTLPPQRLAAVADFVDFLRVREEKARTQKEIQAEIEASRAERRAGPHANRR